MTWSEDWNGAESELAGLRVHDASPERTERVRARCVGALAAKAKWDRAGAQVFRRFVLRLEPAFALTLSALYLAAAIGQSIALLR